jgi:hypothetical protein
MGSSRFDKVDPFSGGFRAKLNAAIVSANKGNIYAVSLNTSGRVVIGASAIADVRGVICATEAMDAGAAIDVMTDGEIADATMTSGTVFAAGLPIYGHLDGTVDQTATAGKALGWTVELDRAVIRCSNSV